MRENKTYDGILLPNITNWNWEKKIPESSLRIRAWGQRKGENQIFGL